MAKIPFTDNYVDLSSGRGTQFKSHCQKCGNGYVSTFQTNTLSTVATAAQVVSNMFGGLLGRAAQSAQSLEQAVAGPQHDAALRNAVAEIAPTFKQCTRCGQWVCEPMCRNKQAQLCENCAPDLDEEITSAQAQAAKAQAIEKAREVNYLGERDLTQRAPVTCPQCGARTQGGKSCPECGAGPAQGRGLATLDEEGLSVGPLRVAWIDTDRVALGPYRIELTLWPAGTLELSELGRRFESFATELAAARNRARVAGWLAHGVTPPSVFGGEWIRDAGAEPVEIQVYPTHVTIVASDQDLVQIPLGALASIEGTANPPAVELSGPGLRVELGRLGRRREALIGAVTAARDLQARTLTAYTGRTVFADGHGVPRGSLEGFDYLLERCCSPERLDGARELLSLAAGGEPRLGYAQLLDPDSEAVRARAPLPENWASFLLVPVGPRVVLEILAGPSAATYVFEGDIADVNRDLQQLHFRRAQLALSDAQAAITPDNPHRLALRRLEPLKRLRAATRARVIHTTDWSGLLRAAVVNV